MKINKLNDSLLMFWNSEYSASKKNLRINSKLNFRLIDSEQICIKTITDIFQNKI